MMHMTFYWGRDVTLLFDSWKTKTWAEYCLTLLTCFLFSAFYQYLEDRRLRLKQPQLSSSSSSSSTAPTTTTPLLDSKLGGSGGARSLVRLLGAAMFGVNAAIGYMLMLAVMSFNGGVFVAIVVGLSVGYLVFRSHDQDVVVVDNPCACA
ncbi:copper transporter 5.1-like [Rhododendron vialii]|uniref:copper transporter 5.1-like n=1 Tax=Rhododendron vialii TaxID=182163 RepID=UPI00265D90CF|nr:copper transporter 5.1-like [Rhododendron vialii]